MRSTFIKLPFATKTFVLCIFERPLKTGFAVTHLLYQFNIKCQTLGLISEYTARSHMHLSSM